MLTGIDGTVLDGDVSAREWLRNGAVIAGAAGASLLLTAADLGAQIAFQQTATGPGGSASQMSAAIGPVEAAIPAPTAPAKITTLTATPGDGEVTLAWTAPDDGGSAITDYRVTYAGAIAEWTTSETGFRPPHLTNGTPYDFIVRAENAVGPGEWSDPVTATPESAELIVGPEYYDLADDFETPPGVTALTGRAHWSGDLDQFVTDAGALRKSAYGQSHQVLLGDGPWGDVDVTFDYRTGDVDPVGGQAWEHTRQKLRVWHRDADNYIDLGLNTVNRRLDCSVRVAGVTTNRVFSNLLGTGGGNGVEFLPAGKLRVQIRDGIMRVWLDGATLARAVLAPPWGIEDLSALVTSPANRQGLVGVQQSTFRWPVLDGVAVRAADVVCEYIDGAVGRDAYDRDEGTVTYGGSYSGAPVGWVSRLLDDRDRSVVLRDWQSVTATLDAEAGTYRISEALPLGGPYIVEHGWLDADGQRHTTLSPPTLVARRIIAYGQSTSVGRGGASTHSYATLPRGAVPASVYNGSANYAPGYMANATDPYVRLSNEKGFSFTDAFQQIADTPVMFEAYGSAGSSLSGVMEGSAHWSLFMAALATRKGVVEAVIWDQGQGDADVPNNSFPPNLAAYPDKFMDGIVAPLRALFDNPALPFFISHMGRYGGTPPASLTQAQFDANRDAFRRMAFALTVEGGGSDPHIHSSSHHDGLVYGDAYHPSGPDGIGRLNERDAWTVAKHALGLPVPDGRGPTPIAMTRSAAVLTIAMDMNGADLLGEIGRDTRSGSSIYPEQPANRIKGWDFSKTSDFAALLPVTALVAEGNAIKVTLAADPGGPVYARNLYGAGYDDMTMIHGGYSGEGPYRFLPVEPTMAGPLVSD